jgi:putative hydrolase of the HAD superfamily
VEESCQVFKEWIVIKTIISDLGNIIVYFNNDLFFQRIKKYSPYSIDDMKIMADQYTPLLQAFDTGRISPKDFYRKVTGILKAGIDQDTFFPFYNDVFSINTSALKTLISLKPRYRLIMLSNTDVERFSFIKKAFPEIRIFDEYVLSYEQGIMKPHPSIFLKALERSEAEAVECVFIDDIEENILAASELGIKTIHFLPYTNLEAELHKLGVILR